jgi:hypothetical protein
MRSSGLLLSDYWLRNNSKERISQLLRGGSLSHARKQQIALCEGLALEESMDLS